MDPQLAQKIARHEKLAMCSFRLKYAAQEMHEAMDRPGPLDGKRAELHYWKTQVDTLTEEFDAAYNEAVDE
jgi:hypothetical protein